MTRCPIYKELTQTCRLQEVMVDEDDPDRGFVNIRAGFHSGPVGEFNLFLVT